MKAVLPLYIFIDACGWEIVRDRPFLHALAPHRRRLESVFGYSSACVPSILAGRWPVDHRNWSYFVYDPARSPFRFLRPLRWIPAWISSRRKFRRLLSRVVKTRLGFRGYFDLYNIPFRHISLFDFTEKKSPLQPRGMNRGDNIFDCLQSRGIAYHVSNPAHSEAENLAALRAAVEAEQIDFAFLYWPGLDGLLHQVGNQAPDIAPKLQQYEQWITDLVATARQHYESVQLHVFSDHGMANCDQLLDLKRQIEPLPLRFGTDYVAVYDSTMARFWFMNDRARKMIEGALRGIPQGRILPDAELERLGALFPDHYFGELIFLVQEGVLIVPSDMGARPIRAMHGYHPADPHSYAALMSNVDDVPATVTAIPHMFHLMLRDAETAQVRNRPGAGPVEGRGPRVRADSAGSREAAMPLKTL